MSATAPPIQPEPRPGTPDDLILPHPFQRRRMERESQVRGLLLLALATILFAILRAGPQHVFPAGWWRLW